MSLRNDLHHTVNCMDSKNSIFIPYVNIVNFTTPLKKEINLGIQLILELGQTAY